MEVIDKQSSFSGVDIEIRTLSALPELTEFKSPTDPSDPNSEGFAHLTEVRNGLRAFRNKGTSYQRGYNHGFVLAQQIIDFFEFFLLDDRIRGSLNEQKYKYDGPFGFTEGIMKHMTVSPEFTIRANGMLSGMAARAAQDETFSMYLPHLKREFSFVDVMAINTYNSYGKISELMGQPPLNSNNNNSSTIVNSDDNSCTQFIFFGDKLTGSAGTIAARNMDGENDLRKITVRSLVLFAEEPDESEADEQVREMRNRKSEIGGV